MLKLKEAVIVEGKYDKQRLSQFIDAPIITTSGFRVFSDKEKQTLIRTLSKERGLVVMTDSDSAGALIRNFLKGITDANTVRHCYIPQVEGKEKRKTSPSKEGFLGVEGLSEEILRDALIRCGITPVNEEEAPKYIFTKTDLFDLGLCGRENSKALREKLLKSMDFPPYLSSNALLEIINIMFTPKELLDKLAKL